MLSIINKVLNDPWAITETYLQTIIQVAERQNLTPEAVAQELGRELRNTQTVEVRDGVAIVPINGPLFRYANMMTRISGATSYEILARDFREAVASDDVRGIILNIDSPGGEVNGVSELADQIYAARGSKPIVSYVDGSAASGGYWLASAADRIVTSDTGMLGSIGVRVALVDTSQRDENEGIRRYSIVSSQSPNKDIDPSSAEDRERVQALVDQMAGIFVSRVARQRGTDADTVISEFGGGDVFLGQEAVARGMADEVGDFESLVAELAEESGQQSAFSFGGGSASREQTSGKEGEPMKMFLTSEPAEKAEKHEVTAEAVTEHAPDVAQALREEGAESARESFEGAEAKDTEEVRAKAAKAERERVTAILGAEEAKGRGQAAQHLALETEMDVEQALGVLKNTPKAGAPDASFFQQMDAETNPDVGPEGDAGGEVDEAEAAKAAVEVARQQGVIQ